jgi:phage terminase large subunit
MPRPSLRDPSFGEDDEEVREIVTYKPFPAQQVFHDGKFTFRLYGGAAGGGKSRALRAEAVRMATSRKDGVAINGLVLRKTYSELEKAIIRPLLQEISNTEYTFNSSDHKMVFKNGSTIDFGHCQYDKDVIKYQGAEYDFIAIDELTHFSEYAFKFLMSRLRTTKPGVKPSFFGTTNPGGIGHLWVKRLWIDRDFGAKENPDDYIFYPARVYDNPALIDNDPEYVSRLEALPETERRALLDGDWNVFDGQYFDEWRDELHVIDPFQIPAGARRIICVDYGYAAPSAVLWLAEFNEKIYCYRELYENRLTYKMLSEKIIENTPET